MLNIRQKTLLQWLIDNKRYGKSNSIDKMDLLWMLALEYGITLDQYDFFQKSRYSIGAYRKMSDDIQIINEFAETNNTPLIISKSGVGIYLATEKDLHALKRKLNYINNHIGEQLNKLLKDDEMIMKELRGMLNEQNE